MADYRFYQLTRGRIMSAEVHNCADDGAALALAGTLLESAVAVCEAIEVWHLTRLVGTVPRGSPADPATRA